VSALLRKHHGAGGPEAAGPRLHLSIARNGLGPVGGLKLAEALSGGAPLASLDARGNGFGASALAALVTALTGVRTLGTLSLGANLRPAPASAPPAAVRRSGSSAASGAARESAGGASRAAGGSGAGHSQAWPSEDTDGELCPAPRLATSPSVRAAARREDDAAALQQLAAAVAALLANPACLLRRLELGGGGGDGSPGGASGGGGGAGYGGLLSAVLVALAANTSLTDADLSCHPSAAAEPAVESALVAVLVGNRSLQALQLHGCGLPLGAAASAVGAWERSNLTLQRLRLWRIEPAALPEAAAVAALQAEGVPPGFVPSARALATRAVAVARRNARISEAMERALGD